jgi:hypothetical protein
MATARFAKTEKGHAEIAQRRRNLRGKLRTVLFLVDPGKSLEEIRQQAAQIGAPDDVLGLLLAEGYIVEVGPGIAAAAAAAPVAAAPGAAAETGGAADELTRYRVAKAFMNDAVVDALGVRAFFFTLRLERCATRAELAAMLDDFATALGRKLERVEVDVLLARARELVTPA